MWTAIILALLLSSVLYVHYRGRERHRWRKQMFDHSSLMAPLNTLLYLMSRVPATPYVEVDRFPGLRELEKHWQTIRDEAQTLADRIKASEHNDDAGFNSFFKEGWKRFYLKWYEVAPPSASLYCPKTVEVLKGIPCVKAALFAELPAGAKLNPHRDPYAGSLRYHLGLATPNDDACRIWVDGEVYSWRDGGSVVFDETYIHHVRNDTDRSRLILLCDIERPLRFRWAEALNRAFARHVMSAAASPNDAGDRTGVIGKLFKISFVSGKLRRRFKNATPRLYKVTRYALMLGAVVGLGWWIVR
ncbi:MAG TPA: aspartyl/asparaginyl beta-hydroxylase domain-containing protein [Burkholderiaceae bacterium]